MVDPTSLNENLPQPKCHFFAFFGPGLSRVRKQVQVHVHDVYKKMNFSVAS